MTDYKEPYVALFNAVTKALQQLRATNYGQALDTLVQAQQKAEELYIGGEE